MNLTKNSGSDKYGYRGIGFDVPSQFSLQNAEWNKNVIFGVYNISPVHADNN